MLDSIYCPSYAVKQKTQEGCVEIPGGSAPEKRRYLLCVLFCLFESDVVRELRVAQRLLLFDFRRRLLRSFAAFG